MTEEPPAESPVPPAAAPLSDEEVLKRADEIQKAREAAHQEELRKAEELKKAEEAKKAEAIAEAERIKRLEDEKKADELRRAQELVRADEEKKAAEARKAEELKEQARREAEKEAREAAKMADAEAPKKKHTGIKIFGIIILLLLIFGIVVVISSSVTITPLGTDGTYSYATGYNVWLPLNQEFNLGGYKVIALSTADSMMISLGGVTYPLTVGDVTYIPDQMGTLSIFWGKVPIMTVKYDIALTYLGVADNGQAAFRMVIASDRQLPETLIKLFLSMSGVTVASA